MDQPRLFCAELFRIEAVPLQIARALVGEEDVSVLQQALEFRAILFGIIQDRRTHPHLDVPDKRLNLGIVGPPDVEDIGPVAGEISAHASSGNHMPHSECANAIQRALSIFLERDRFAVADLLHRDQRHPGEHLGILTLLLELVEGAHLSEDKSLLGSRVLQVVGAPLQNCVLQRFDAGATPEEVERAGA